MTEVHTWCIELDFLNSDFLSLFILTLPWAC